DAKPVMKNLVCTAALLLLAAVFCGCASDPVRNEIPLVKGLASKATDPNDTKVVIFNQSSMVTHGLDNSGRINVKLNGKGVGQLNINEYVQVIVSKGPYELDLEHRDLVSFRSHHKVEFTGPESFLRINATVISHEA